MRPLASSPFTTRASVLHSRRRVWSRQREERCTETRLARLRRRSFAFMAMTRQPVAERTGARTIVRVGVVALARTSDVLPRGASQETSVSLNNNGGDKHEGDAAKADENGVRKKQDQDHESDQEAHDAPADATSTVRVNIGFTD